MYEDNYKQISIALKLGEPRLNTFQKDVLEECLERSGGGISLKMGSGKSIISLIISLKQMSQQNHNQIEERPLTLVVAPKTLIDSWSFEIEKFFEETVPFQIINKTFKLEPDTLVVFVTPGLVGLHYKDNNLETHFIHKEQVQENIWDRPTIRNTYNRPVKPFIKTMSLGPTLIFSKRWTSLIVDEAHKYTKIDTLTCQGIGSICSRHRWLLSGTLFSEPTVERILGYNIMLDSTTFPRNLPDACKTMYSPDFKGLKATLIYRDPNSTSNKNKLILQNPHTISSIKLNKHIIEHNLTEEEALLYTTMKGTLKILKEYVLVCKRSMDTEGIKKFTSYILAMITYLRQSIVCPLIPVANIALDMSDYTIKSDLSNILHNQLKELHLDSWLSKEESSKSSRIVEVLKTIKKHRLDKIVLFSCFRTSIDLLKYFIEIEEPGYNVFELTSTMSIKKRGQVLKNFKNSSSGILLLSYEMGSEGLNLQEANTIIILDFWFNSSKTDQSIARVLRYGQLSPEVNVYMYTSNTGIEKALFNKQADKLIVLEEVMTGPMKSSVRTMKMDDIIKLIEKTENVNLVTKLYKSKSS